MSTYLLNALIAQEQCEGRGGRPGIRVPNSPYVTYGRKAKLKKTIIMCSQKLVLWTLSL